MYGPANYKISFQDPFLTHSISICIELSRVNNIDTIINIIIHAIFVSEN